jgi:hypothetical protein
VRIINGQITGAASEIGGNNQTPILNSPPVRRISGKRKAAVREEQQLQLHGRKKLLEEDKDEDQERERDISHTVRSRKPVQASDSRVKSPVERDGEIRATTSVSVSVSVSTAAVVGVAETKIVKTNLSNAKSNPRTSLRGGAREEVRDSAPVITNTTTGHKSESRLVKAPPVRLSAAAASSHQLQSVRRNAASSQEKEKEKGAKSGPSRVANTVHSAPVIVTAAKVASRDGVRSATATRTKQPVTSVEHDKDVKRLLAQHNEKLKVQGSEENNLRRLLNQHNKKLKAAEEPDDELVAMLKQHNKKVIDSKSTFEPRKGSVSAIRAWEKVHGKSYYSLSTEERRQVNEELCKK